MILALATTDRAYHLELPPGVGIHDFSRSYFQRGELIPLGNKVYLNPAHVRTVWIEEDE